MHSKRRLSSFLHATIALVGILKFTIATCPNSNKVLLRSGLTCQEKKDILKIHNNLRQVIALGYLGQPPARNMVEMTWDNELEAKAQALADTCRYGHDSPSARAVSRFHVGQNIGLTWITLEPRSDPDFSARIRAWFDEVRYYKFGNPFSRVTGHYTQIVWQDTSLIGCGYSYFLDGNRFTKLYVCNYGPAGNVLGYVPYEVGRTSCDAKKLVFSRYYSGLCEKTDVGTRLKCS